MDVLRQKVLRFAIISTWLITCWHVDFQSYRWAPATSAPYRSQNRQTYLPRNPFPTYSIAAAGCQAWWAYLWKQTRNRCFHMAGRPPQLCCAAVAAAITAVDGNDYLSYCACWPWFDYISRYWSHHSAGSSADLPGISPRTAVTVSFRCPLALRWWRHPSKTSAP